MKEYDRQQRKWVKVDERIHKPVGNPCDKKHLEHELVLVLPPYVRYTTLDQYHPEDYYRIEEEISKFNNAKYKELQDLGIVPQYATSWNTIRGKYRYYICSRCKKQLYKSDIGIK